MKSGIYKITNKLNGKFYIGSSVNLKRRLAEHTYRFKNNINHNSKIKNAINKYGKDNFIFEILEEVIEENRTILDNLLAEKEQFYVDILKPYYNIRIKDINRNVYKLSEAQLNHLKTVNIGRKQSQSCVAKRMKPVLAYDKAGNFISYFSCAKEAGVILKIHPSNITRACQGKISNRNYIFNYKTD